MKICYIVNSLNIKGGVERILADTVNYLTTLGTYDIEIITVSESKESAYCYNNRVSIKSVTFFKKNIPFFCRFISLLSFGQSLRAYLKERRPDIVIKVQTSGFSWVIPFVCHSIPKILWIHTSRKGLEISMKKYQSPLFCKIYWKFCRFFMSLYHKTVLLTEEDYNDWNLSNAIVIPNFSNFIGLKIEPVERQNKMICVARYDYNKRIDLLLDAWSFLYDKYTDWTFSFYGGWGTEKEKLQSQIEDLKIQERTFLFDACDNIIEKYNESKLFCFASEFEGLPLVLIEAMACGLPIITFEAPGVSFLVKDNYNGFLVPRGNMDLYIERLQELLESEPLRTRLGANGIIESSLYSKEHIVKKWQTLFVELS